MHSLLPATQENFQSEIFYLFQSQIEKETSCQEWDEFYQS
jgi:hypothetical protein